MKFYQYQLFFYFTACIIKHAVPQPCSMLQYIFGFYKSPSHNFSAFSSISIIFLHMPPFFSLIKHVLQIFCSPFSSINTVSFVNTLLSFADKQESCCMQRVLSHIGKNDREEEKRIKGNKKMCLQISCKKKKTSVVYLLT